MQRSAVTKKLVANQAGGQISPRHEQNSTRQLYFIAAPCYRLLVYMKGCPIWPRARYQDCASPGIELLFRPSRCVDSLSSHKYHKSVVYVMYAGLARTDQRNENLFM